MRHDLISRTHIWLPPVVGTTWVVPTTEGFLLREVISVFGGVFHLLSVPGRLQAFYFCIPFVRIELLHFGQLCGFTTLLWIYHFIWLGIGYGFFKFLPRRLGQSASL